MISVCVVGCGGKLGKELCQKICSIDDIVLGAAVTSKNGKLKGKKISEIIPFVKSDLKIIDNINEAPICDVYIDATSRDALVNNNLQEYFKIQKPLIIATTGLSDKDVIKIKGMIKNKFPVIISPNYSWDFWLFVNSISCFCSSFLGNEVNIIEKHHNQKIDAPSGTALIIRDEIKASNPQISVTIHSIRAGNITGEHEVILTNPMGELISFKHNASSREPFVLGILKSVRIIQSLENRLFDLKELVIIKN